MEIDRLTRPYLGQNPSAVGKICFNRGQVKAYWVHWAGRTAPMWKTNEGDGQTGKRANGQTGKRANRAEGGSSAAPPGSWIMGGGISTGDRNGYSRLSTEIYQ